MITKCILPVAGWGTRFLPASKSIPKEMAIVVDRPAIDYVVREAVEAGIKQIILVTHSSKSAIENYFDSNVELEKMLIDKRKFDLLAQIQNILPKDVSVVSVRQHQPLGLGHAILCAKSVVADEPFAVLLPDVLVKNKAGESDLRQMIKRFNESASAQVMVGSVPWDQVNQYGIVDVAHEPHSSQSVEMHRIVEKPAVDQAPSNLAVIGRYILPARVMQLLENTPKGVGEEIQLTDAIATLLLEQPIEAYRMLGDVFDCGSKLGYLKAILYYGVEHPELGGAFNEMIQQMSLPTLDCRQSVA